MHATCEARPALLKLHIFVKKITYHIKIFWLELTNHLILEPELVLELFLRWNITSSERINKSGTKDSTGASHANSTHGWGQGNTFRIFRFFAKNGIFSSLRYQSARNVIKKWNKILERIIIKKLKITWPTPGHLFS